MKRVVLLLSLIAVMSLVLALAAQAHGVEYNERIPFEFEGGPLCGGEDVHVSGIMHFLGNVTEDKAGGTHFVDHTNYQFTEAVSVPSGDQVVIRDVSNNILNGTLDDTGQMEVTSVVGGRLIRLGEDGTHTDDTLFHATFHITQNANGEVTAVVENVVFHCD